MAVSSTSAEPELSHALLITDALTLPHSIFLYYIVNIIFAVFDESGHFLLYASMVGVKGEPASPLPPSVLHTDCTMSQLLLSDQSTDQQVCQDDW